MNAQIVMNFWKNNQHVKFPFFVNVPTTVSVEVKVGEEKTSFQICIDADGHVVIRREDS